MGGKPDRPKDWKGFLWWLVKYHKIELLIALLLASILSGAKIETKYFSWESPLRLYFQNHK